jgi:hypothetical protein
MLDYAYDTFALRTSVKLLFPGVLHGAESLGAVFSRDLFR